MPFLTESVDDDDEVLLSLAEQLGRLVPHVGGPEHAVCLLDPLERLATAEEVTVRDKAVESLSAIIGVIPEAQVAEHVLAVLRRLCEREWFTSRVSAAGLLAVTYARLAGPDSPARAEVRTMFRKLCEDDTPMVRRAASAHLGPLAVRVGAELAVAEFSDIASRLASDDQDSVRLLAVDNCVALSALLPGGGNILPLVVRLAEDHSWRVRWSVANKFVELCDALGPGPSGAELLTSFTALLSDGEAEVRAAAASKVTDVAKKVPLAKVMSNILPVINSLVDDSSEHVRASLASAVMGLAPVFGEEGTVAHLLPLFLKLLKDTVSQVRLNVISKLEALNRVIGVRLLSESLLPAILELAEDGQWRVRLAIIEFMPLIARQLGLEFFDAELTNLCVRWLGDDVSSIRESAAENLKNLTEVFGNEWAARSVFPQIQRLAEEHQYLLRLTALRATLVRREGRRRGGRRGRGSGRRGEEERKRAESAVSLER